MVNRNGANSGETHTPPDSAKGITISDTPDADPIPLPEDYATPSEGDPLRYTFGERPRCRWCNSVRLRNCGTISDAHGEDDASFYARCLDCGHRVIAVNK